MEKVRVISGIILITIFSASCTEKVTPPVLSTMNVTQITSKTAVSGGQISNDFGNKIITKGICWKISENPTIEDDTTMDRSESSSFSSQISNLQPNTKYYVRAYGTNSEGTGYGNSISFQTLVNPWLKISGAPWDKRMEAFSFAIGDFIFIGAGASQYGEYQDFWAFNTKTNLWVRKSDFAGGPRLGMVAFSINGKGYAGLGSDINNQFKDFYLYDPETDIWKAIAEFPGEGGAQKGVVVINQKAYVLSYFGWQYFETWEYNPVNNTWTQKSNCNTQQTSRLATFVINGKGYSCTGWNGGQSFNELWEYNPINDTWTKKSPFPGVPRADAIGFALNNKGYVGGGTNYTGENYYKSLKDFFVYSQDLDSWSKIDDFPDDYAFSTVCSTTNDKAYISSGSAIGTNGHAYSNSLWIFTPN
jgi:N-acetylneuraminic acid mutarotase